MLNQMTSFFVSAFNFPGLDWKLILAAIALSIVFGAIWLTAYWPSLKKPSLWIIAIISAFLTWTAIAFVQIPLQSWTGQALIHIWNAQTLTKWILLAAMPQILLSGIVQEAAKLVPVYLFWWRSKKSFTPRFGLIAGALSGAGFGIFEAVWAHNQIFASGWAWSSIEKYGFMGIMGFWERFFSIGFHIAASALVGYGLAKHKGWLFYIIAAFLHGAMNYSIVLLETNHFTAVQDEIYTAIFAVLVTGVVLWLRWYKPKEIPAINPQESIPPPEPAMPLS